MKGEIRNIVDESRLQFEALAQKQTDLLKRAGLFRRYHEGLMYANHVSSYRLAVATIRNITVKAIRKDIAKLPAIFFLFSILLTPLNSAF